MAPDPMNRQRICNMNDMMYCYPDSEVLRNKLGINDQKKLQEVERKLTAIRINDLIHKPVFGRFDLKHLCDIHFYIFQDLYIWAGELNGNLSGNWRFTIIMQLISAIWMHMKCCLPVRIPFCADMKRWRLCSINA